MSVCCNKRRQGYPVHSEEAEVFVKKKEKKVVVAEGIREVSAIQLENRWPGGAVGTRSATPLFSDIPRGGISQRGGKWVGDGIC